MKKLTFIFIFLATFSLSACNSNAGNNTGAPENAEGQVVKLTAESFQKLVWDYKKNPQEWVFLGDQPVIIDFYATWCTPCRELDDITFHHPEVVKLAERDFVMVKIDLTQKGNPVHQRLLSQYAVKGVPTVVFLDRRGQECPDLRVVDYLPPEQFLNRMVAVGKN